MKRLYLIVLVLVSDSVTAQTCHIDLPKHGLIQGLSNAFTVVVDGVSDDSISVTTDKWKLTSNNNGQYLISPDSLGEMVIHVFRIHRHSTSLIWTYRVQVKEMPLPTVRFGPYNPGLIVVDSITTSLKLNASIEISGATIYGVKPRIISYDLCIFQTNAIDTSHCYQVAENQLSNELNLKLQHLEPDDWFVFANIQVMTATGLLNLQSVSYTVID
jgi:hypothetical protein